ncbi:MAG: hypothetical protein ACD_24C00456G0001, partial [uncultured bacterium]
RKFHSKRSTASRSSSTCHINDAILEGRMIYKLIAPLLPWFSRNIINILILNIVFLLNKPKGYIKINKNDLAKIFLSGIFFTFSKELANFFENLMEMEKEIQIVLSARFI